MNRQYGNDPTPHFSNVKLLVRGTGISTIGMFASRGLQYLFLILIARSVSAAAYGSFNVGLASINLVGPLALLGLHFGAIRFVARARSLGDHAGERWLIRSSVAIVALSGAAVAIAYRWLLGPLTGLYAGDGERAVELIPSFAYAIPLFALVILVEYIFNGQKKIGRGVVVAQLVQPVAAILLVLPFFWRGASLEDIVRSYTLSLVIALLPAAYWLLPYFRVSAPSGAAARQMSMREVGGYSLPLVPMSIVRQLGNRLEIYLLGLLALPEEVAIFSAASATAVLVTFGLKAVWSIYSAIASELQAKNDMAQLEFQLQLATRWSTAMALPALLIILFLGEEILLLFNEQFVVGALALSIVAFGQFVNAASGPIGVTLNMAGYSRLFLVNNVVILIVNIVADWWLITRYGVVGAAIGSAASVVILNIALVAQVRHLLGIRPYSQQLLRPILAAIATSALVLPLTYQMGALSFWSKFALGLPLTLGVFGLFFWLLMSAEDRRLVQFIGSRLKGRLVH